MIRSAEADAPQVNKITTPTILRRSDHNISRSNISEHAIKVLYRLHNAGYEAYLVGGGVRDLLLGREPKDFDVATSARPEEVDALFRNCRLVGRRFRLAHIHFGREVIEVATFRGAGIESADEAAEDQHQNSDGMLLRDNVYGTLEEDAWRRDFNVNALYYNIADFSVVDYTGGIKDLEAGELRLLGDPEIRYREDPVRMLRAARFSAKLGFRLTEESEKLIWELGELLEAIPAARLFDETLKLLMSGTGEETFHTLRHYHLLDYLFPLTEDSINDEDGERVLDFVGQGLYNTDDRLATGKPVTPAFLFAVMLWEPVRLLAQEKQGNGAPAVQAVQRAASEVLAEQMRSVSIPKRFTIMMKEIWSLQPRFQYRDGKRPHRLFMHPRFRAAYDFLLLRAESGEIESEVAEWWTKYQEVDEEQRAKMARPAQPRRRRRRRKPRSNPGESQKEA